MAPYVVPGWVYLLVVVIAWEIHTASSHSPNQVLPMCCPLGDIVHSPAKCGPLQAGWDPRIKLPGDKNINFEHKGLPQCYKGVPIAVDVDDALFIKEKVYLPTYHSVSSTPLSDFCVSNAWNETTSKQELRVFICKETIKQVFPFQDNVLHFWLWVILAHILLLLTLLTFIIVKDLRRLQGRYVICFLLFVLLFIFLRVPGSDILFHFTETPCLILGNLKPFLFTCVVSWFTAFCMEILISIRYQVKVLTWRRFMLELLVVLCSGVAMAGIFMAILYFNEGAQGLFTKDAFDEDTCKYHAVMDRVLLVVALLLVISDLFMLLLASFNFRKYKRLGYGLYRFEARLWLKQGWQLLIFTALLILLNFPKYLVDMKLHYHLIALLESLVIYGMLAHWKLMDTPWTSSSSTLPRTRQDLPNSEKEAATDAFPPRGNTM